jgi:cytidylate kinase
MARYIEDLVSKQVRLSELARCKGSEKGKAITRPVITMSRRMGSGARIVAQKLAEELEWSLWDREIIEEIAQNADVSRKVVEAFDEHTVSEIEAFTRSVLGDYEWGGFLYGRHLARAVASIAELGNAIILGRGAMFLLPKALNIRVDASDEVRIRNMMTYEDLTSQQAEARIKQSDRDRREFLLNTFGREKVEHARYDLTIWMDEFRPEDAVEIIKTTLEVWLRRHPDRETVL